jgi:hypothetical protein
MGEDGQQPGPQEQLQQLFGQAEKQTADAMEQLVHRDAFGEILARVTENVMGVARIGFDVLDLTVRNLRIAGRPDLIRLGRQFARNEDKLERVLQEVERVQDQVEKLEGGTSRSTSRSNGSRSSNGRSRSRGGSKSSSSSRTRGKASG